MPYGIFDVPLVGRSLIDQQLLFSARDDTDLLSVVYPEVEFLYKTRYANHPYSEVLRKKLSDELEQMAYNISELIKDAGGYLYGSQKSRYFLNEDELRHCVGRAVYAAYDLAIAQIKYSPLSFCEVMRVYREHLSSLCEECRRVMEDV